MEAAPRPHPEPWVTVFAGPPWKVAILEGEFAAHGIPCLAPDRLIKTIDPFITGANALDLRLEVPHAFAADALALLAEHDASARAAPPLPPEEQRARDRRARPPHPLGCALRFHQPDRSLPCLPLFPRGRADGSAPAGPRDDDRCDPARDRHGNPRAGPPAAELTPESAVGLLLKNLLFTLAVPGAVAVLVPLAIASDRAAAGGLARSAGFLLLAGGATIYAWTVWDFARHGRGTPAPVDAPQRLVVRGLYRRVRNPMYLGVLGVIAGWAALYRSPRIALYGGCMAALFHAFVRSYEEPRLARKFGAEYARYRAHVPRWLPLAPRRRATLNDS